MKATKSDLKKIDRLQKRSDFLLMNTSAKKWVSKSLIVLSMDNAYGHPRYGITVTKKLEKTSVGRNRMKRRLRNIAAETLSARAHLSKDYVLIARHGVATKPYNELTGEFLWCLEKLGHENL
jgi:ribonuclease P protein component